jgi:uncharacterized protein
MSQTKQRRTVPGEFRAEGDTPKLIGHAAVFNSLSEDLGGWRERIAPGAFTDAIQTDTVKALWNHNSDFVIASNKAGTLRLAEDTVGLAIEADPPDTQWMRDHLVTIRRGDVNQMSFGFWVQDVYDENGNVVSRGDSWKREGDMYVRTLLRVRLFDVSPVTYPAYAATDVSVRSAILDRAKRALEETGELRQRDRAWFQHRARAAAAG